MTRPGEDAGLSTHSFHAFGALLPWRSPNLPTAM
jgi:hypothetical protein